MPRQRCGRFRLYRSEQHGHRARRRGHRGRASRAVRRVPPAPIGTRAGESVRGARPCARSGRGVAVPLAVAHPADRQRCPRPPRDALRRDARSRCRLRTGRRRRPPLLRALRETIRVAGPPPGTRAGGVRSRRAARGGDAGRDVSDPRARQRHRHLGAAVRPLGARRRTIRGTSTAHPRLSRRPGVRGPARDRGRRRHLGGATARRDLVRHDHHMGDASRAPVPGGAVHARDRTRGRRPRRGSGSTRSAAGLGRLGHRAAGHARHPGRARTRSPAPAPDVLRDHRNRRPLGRRHRTTCRRHLVVHGFFGRRSTISRRCGYAVPAEASR